MKHFFKHIQGFLVTILCSSLSLSAARPVNPYISIRSQGQNSALEMSGWSFHRINDNESGDLSISTEYNQSFRNNDITQALFGCYSSDNCTTLSIKGSAIADRTENDLLADWFYLPNNYLGTVALKPQVQSVVTALNAAFLSDELAPGFYASMRIPVAWTRWNLNSVFFTEDEGTIESPFGIYLNDAENFFCSKSTDFDTTFTAARLSCARFGCHDCTNTGARSITKLTDIQTNIGYTFFFSDNDYTLGLFARLVIPTGNRPHGEWLFEPIAGNGHHWELGGGINASARFWHNEDDTKQAGFYFDSTLTHLFATRQNRVFDLKCKPLSRYMTAAHFVDGVVTEHAPLANLTSCAMDVSVGVQADIVMLFNYTTHNWSYDCGYNLWARSCEKFHCSSKNCTDCCGKCVIKKGEENWGLSIIGSTETRSLSTIVEQAPVDTTSVFITNDDIDYAGARTKGLSHKIFANSAYSWLNLTSVPYISLGGDVELGNNSNCCSPEKSCCKNIALSQWSVWLKGGVSF